MEIRPILNTFFNVTIATNGHLEATGNRLMRPWKTAKYYHWIDVKQDRYNIMLSDQTIINELIVPIATATLILNLAWMSLVFKSRPLAFAAVVILPATMIVGVIIKLMSWIFFRSVREKNFQYIRLKENEKINPTSLLLDRKDIDSRININAKSIHVNDRFSRLPTVLKMVVGEYLDARDWRRLEITAKTQLHDIWKSVQYINRALIKQTFPSTFLNRVGMNKVIEIMSQPPIKFNPSLNTTTTNRATLGRLFLHMNWNWNNRQLIADKIWFFNPNQMENQSLRWGKTDKGSVFWVFTYKQHNALIVNVLGVPRAGPYGMSVICQEIINEQKVLKVIPAFEKFEIGYGDDYNTHTTNKINCFVVDQHVSLDDYIPRLINGEPCGVRTKHADGNITEDVRTIQKPDGIHPMVELMPLPT